MRIVYIGDIMGEFGLRVVEKVLPSLRKEKSIDFVIAQGENVSEGRGITETDMKRLQKAGVDFFSGGNHTPERSEARAMLEDNSVPLVGPANMQSCPGKGWKYAKTPQGDVLVISILGETFGKAPRPAIDNPLLTIDAILKENEGKQRVATVVNFHGDFSSEKRVFGYYLDGKVTMAVGDHWHVPTDDAMILPKGTAHVSDVGMCGSLHSSLGVKADVIIDRWKNGTQNKNELEEDGASQFNAVLVTTGPNSLATHIEPIRLRF